MDLQTLSNLFATTLDPNPNVRKVAELDIRKISGQEGIIAALLQIIASENVDLATRQACSVFLKNRVHSGYPAGVSGTRPDQRPIHDSDRVALKTALPQLLSSTPSRNISVQLSSALKNIIAEDFPEKWPELVPIAKQMLASGKIREVAAGTIVVLEMVRAFRFRQSEADILPKIVAEMFPILVTIASRLLSSPPAGAEQEIPTILHYILKTYRNSITLHLSPHQQSAESLKPWGTLLFQVVNLQIPANAVPENEEERERSEWWKAKKWAYNTLGRLFHRFGNPSQLPSTLKPEYGAFAEHFVTHFAPEIFKVYLHQVELCVSGQTWISNKCQFHMFQFFTECVKPKSTWALLKPHFETLVSRFAFPHLSFTPAKQNLWDLDPVDFVRTSLDAWGEYSSPVAAATSFTLQLVQSRPKATFMPILNFINSVLTSRAAPPQRYGALNITAILGPLILRLSDIKSSMESVIVQHVLPEFQSQNAFMRYIAAELVGAAESNNIKWANEQHLQAAFQAIAAAMQDPELPIRVQAALCLAEMIAAHESVKEQVKPQVEKVIQDLLKLSDETDLDLLSNSMENMVEVFQEELLPVAVALASRLCESYIRLARESVTQDENPQPGDLETNLGEDEDKTYAAMGVAKTIGTIVSIVDASPELLSQVQEVIIPIIVFTLEHRIIDLYDNMYDLVDSLTFKSRAISASMWPVLELTYTLFKSDAIDFLDEMLPALDNFISYGSEVFKSRQDYRHMMLDIYQTAISSSQLGEADRINGCKIAESLLLNLRGHIDDILLPIVATAIDNLDKTVTAGLKLAMLEVLINAVLYNPAPALQLMEQHRAGAARAFVERWFEYITFEQKDRLPRVHDKKLTLCALCALMELEPAQVPDGLQPIVSNALRVFRTLPTAVADRAAQQNALHEISDSEESDQDMNFNAIEDVWDEDSAYIEMLAKEGQRLRQQGQNQDDDDEADDEDEDDDEIEEELGFISPLEQVDVYVRFKHALNALQIKNAPLYQLATTALSVDEQAYLMELMREAEGREVNAASA
ncbi:ARM repeat-containing protein [Vararia minispora EC-137]|uniref:ARM repeat-containing protein n=1 Tax=Vararia minispora EC-137 TaxID=1314806 RepID=A0ACB8QE28_9AGAM|nr:ARM repeat-containing protein [Vararia minispora EC-137]